MDRVGRVKDVALGLRFGLPTAEDSIPPGTVTVRGPC